MNKWKKSAAHLAAACAVLAALLAGCKHEPMQIVFPYDHGPHLSAKTEWWHFSGELICKTGDSFGYNMTIFKVPLYGEGATYFVNHLAISDLQDTEHTFSESTRIDFPGLGNMPGKPAINVEVASFTFDEDTGFHIVGMNGQGININLQLKPVLPVVLEGDNGTINMPDGHIAYSYSYTNLKTTGEILLNGIYYSFSDNATQSRSWMNHQWGLFSISADARQAWDRFSLSFEDGSSLMALQFRKKDTNKVLNYVASNGLLITPHWVYQRADGTVVRGKRLSTNYTRTWQDTNANATYQMDWTIHIPDLSATITAKPAFDAQSLYALSTPPYWEGIGSADGTIEGTAKNATTHIEMWGYDVQ